MTDFLVNGRIRTQDHSGSKSANGTQQRSSKTRKIASERRRLTLGAIEKPRQDLLNGSSGNNSSGGLNDSSSLVPGVQKIPTDNTGLINWLKNIHVSNIVKSKGKKICFSSVTNELGQESFEEKSIQPDPQMIIVPVSTSSSSAADQTSSNPKLARDELNKLGIGVACRKGLKPESPNQDSYSIFYAEGDMLLIGVYDGHGAQGHHLSQFTKENLPKLFLTDPNRIRDPKQALTDSFARCQRLIDHAENTQGLQAGLSGTTCTIVYQPLCYKEKANRKVYIAFVGDSRASMVSRPVYSDAHKGRDLTIDHKPSLPAEKRRIERNGGRVIFDGFFNHRVFAANRMYPGLNMSRALGDCVAQKEAGLTSVPDIEEYTLKTCDEGEEDVALMVCSDGVWEFLSSQDTCDILSKSMGLDGNGTSGKAAAGLPVGSASKNGGNGNIQGAAEEVAKMSWSAWMEDSENEISDDITAVCVMLNKIK